MGHAARGEIGPTHFHFWNVQIYSSVRRIVPLGLTGPTCAPRKYASWARSHLASPAHKREVSQFRTCHSCDRIGCHHQAQSGKQAGRPAWDGGDGTWEEGDFFLANFSNPHQSLIGLRGRRSDVFVVVKSPLMAADTCNGAEGGGKAPTTPPSLISSLK